MTDIQNPPTVDEAFARLNMPLLEVMMTQRDLDGYGNRAWLDSE